MRFSSPCFAPLYLVPPSCLKSDTSRIAMFEIELVIALNFVCGVASAFSGPSTALLYGNTAVGMPQMTPQFSVQVARELAVQESISKRG